MLKNRYISSFFVFLFCITPAYANAGIPMLGAIWPPAIISLWVVILIESRYMQKSEVLRHHKIKKSEIEKMVRLSNIVSTVFGMPLVWFILVVFQLTMPGGGNAHYDWGNWGYIYGVTVQAAWILPYESQLYWMIPATYIILMIPCFFVSYWIELQVNYGCIKSKIDLDDLKQIVWNANLRSYAFLILFPIGAFLYYGVWIELLGFGTK